MQLKFIAPAITILLCTLHTSAFPSSTENISNGNQTTVLDATTVDNKPILLVISYDGFRNEYLRRNVTPNLLQFRNEGVYTDHMLNVFPTKTFTNHHSISTGFYPNVHGVLANSLYDTLEGSLYYSYKLFHYNDSILPIWVVNERSGGYTGCMMWPGSNFEYANTTCTYTQKYDPNIPLKERVDTVMKWITNPEKPANLVMFYSEQPDKLAHSVGPDSDKITEMVASLDLLTKYIQEQLAVYKVENRTNVIHLSDHGMAGVPQSRFINLTDYLEEDTYKMYGTSPVLQVVPIEGKVEEVYQRLKQGSQSNGNFDVYKSEDLPKRWHAYNERRFGPIIAVAKINYAFQDLWNQTTSNSTEYGVHGYDNEEELMRPIFMANGPLFKSGGQLVTPFETVDLFFLFTKILGIEDSTARNGSAERILDVLAGDEPKSNNTAAIIFIVLVCLGAILAVIVYVTKFHKKRHSYSPT